MSPSEDSLAKALRELAAASPQGAPAELGVRLRGAFARHHSRRRRKRIALLTSVALVLMIFLAWLRVSRPSRPDTAAKAQPRTVEPTAAIPAATAPPSAATARLPLAVVAHAAHPHLRPPQQAKAGLSPQRSRAGDAGLAGGPEVRATRKRAARTPDAVRRTSPPAIATADFVALPSFDPAIPIGESRIVRLVLPGSALQLAGYPVDEELLERRVLTDVLVGQDGIPYAVRLIQTQTIP